MAYTVMGDANQVLQSFRVVSDGCTGDQMQYEFTCAAVSLSGVVVFSGGCELADSRQLEYLDRWHIS